MRFRLFLFTANLNFDFGTVKPTLGRECFLLLSIKKTTFKGLQTKKLPSFLLKREVIFFLLFKRSYGLNFCVLFKSSFVRNSKFFSSFCSSSSYNLSSCFSTHSFTKSVFIFSFSSRWLECSFHFLKFSFFYKRRANVRFYFLKFLIISIN